MSRKAATDWYIKYLKAMDSKSHNIAMYEEYLNGLTNKQFDDLMVSIENGEEVLPYYKHTMHGKPLELDKIMKVGENMLGIKFHERLWLTDPTTGVRTLTPEKYLILDGPVRRQRQHMDKGKSLITDDNKIDNTTGQLTKSAKAASLSLPEIAVMDSMGRSKALEELLKVNGGDIAAYRKSKNDMINTGAFTLESMEELDSIPTSSETLSSYLLAMHYDNNFKGDA